MRASLMGLIFSAAALQQAAAEIVLAQPVECTLGETCFIQQYVDHDPSAAARDFTCGALSYDGHTGTDFRLPDFANLTPGVFVLAAATGTVRRVRDGMTDAPLSPDRRNAIAGRGCGNGVVIEHGDGWETQYCHLKQGSLQVRPGDQVQARARLGLIGQSGLAEFPHLELVVRHLGEVVDPFAPDGAQACSAPSRTLWGDPMAYQAGGLMDTGFANAIPDFSAIKAGNAGSLNLPKITPALVLWGYVFGTQAGDQMQLTITGPKGEIVHTTTADFATPQAEAFRASGRRLSNVVWPSGVYLGRITLVRDGRIIDTAETQVVLE